MPTRMESWRSASALSCEASARHHHATCPKLTQAVRMKGIKRKEPECVTMETGSTERASWGARRQATQGRSLKMTGGRRERSKAGANASAHRHAGSVKPRPQKPASSPPPTRGAKSHTHTPAPRASLQHASKSGSVHFRISSVMLRVGPEDDRVIQGDVTFARNGITECAQNSQRVSVELALDATHDRSGVNVLAVQGCEVRAVLFKACRLPWSACSPGQIPQRLVSRWRRPTPWTRFLEQK